MDNIKEMQVEYQKALDELRAEVEKKTADKGKIENLEKGLNAFEEKFQNVLKENLDAKNKAEELEKTLEAMEKKLKSPELNGKKEELKLEEKSFEALLRKGKADVSVEEKKYLRTDNNENGGYLVPVDFRAEIIKKLTDISPVRSVARIITTSRNEVHIPKRETVVSGGWVGEGATASSGESTYGLEKLPVHKLMVYTDITHEMLKDSAFNMASEIQNDVAESFAQLEGSAFISGDAVSKPEGILTNSSVGETNTGNATAITADSLFDIQGDFKAGYLNTNNLVWMLNQDTLYKHIRTLKDGNGQYLLVSGIADGLVPTIAGRPYVVAPDMPDVGAGTYPMVIGDYRQGYYIVDSVAMEMIRDDYTQATAGKVRFVFYRRTNGQVVKAEVIRKLKVSV